MSLVVNLGRFTSVMALSTIITDRGTTVIIEQVRQQRARDDIPEVTTERK